MTSPLPFGAAEETDPYKNISVLYRFLSQCMKYPEPSWMTDDFFDSLYLFLDQLGATQEISKLKHSINNSNDFLTDLQVEYTRLFINGVPHVIAPPFASVYVDGSLQGPHTAKTLTFYREKGCDMAESSDLPDHIVHELEFLSFLAEAGDSEGERQFLERFFFKWFPTFRDRVRNETNHLYYKLVVSMIDYITKEEE